MRGIALTIFLSFWLIFAVLIASFALVPDPGTSIRFIDHLRQHGRIAALLLEQQGEGMCEAYASAAADAGGVQFALLDGQRRPVCPTSPERLRPLASVIRQAADGTPNGPGAILPVATSDESLFVIGVPLPRFTATPLRPPFPYRAVAFAIVISGLVCFAMARYLARPLQLVRDASYRLAAGDLQARAGPIVGRRRDEIGDLVRDFDAMAARLEALAHAQTQLLSDISHELRSPLARLNVALELARRRSAPDAQAHLDRIEMEAVRMNELIGRVLALARAESDHGATQSEVDLGDIVSRVTRDAEYEAHRQQRSVALDVVARPTVTGDAQLLISAVDNVIRNAIRHTARHSAVDVHLDHSDTQAVITVRDRGPGVPQSELERIFSPFHRVESARNADTGGVGLGLAIARRAIGVHRGTIDAVNASDGGLVVTIRLPLRLASARPDRPPAHTTPTV